ncbi:MAG: DNA-processing protein DprA [Dethiobacteria bacterium]
MLSAKYYHALNLIPSLGPLRMKKLIKHFGNPVAIWEASASEFQAIGGFGPSLTQQIVNARQKIDPEQSWQQFLKTGCSAVTWEEPAYPQSLLNIYDPPSILYYKGDIGILNEKPCLGIVGSRRHTVYGREIAYKFASLLSNSGFAIVSGLARGIDSWSHKGAVDSGGKTVAVLGCGVDICYPPENKKLWEKIAYSGVVVSEFPPQTKPFPGNFPRRNRIISGLSLGILVVEAKENSGALITADFALEQGREVFAVPGGIGSPYSRGCHKLIKMGAKLTEKVDDILEEIAVFPSDNKHPIDSLKNKEHEELEIGEDELKLLNCISYEPLLLEDISRQSGVHLTLINLLLLNLELKGLIKQMPGQYYVRI